MKEFLEVLSERQKCEGSSYSILLTIHEKPVEENAEMNPNRSQSFRDRIKAFESQGGDEEGNVSQPPQTSLPPRRASYKPPVAVKPSTSFKSQSKDDSSLNASTTQKQNLFSSPKPQLPTNPGGKSIREELEALHSKGNTPHGPCPPVLTRAESIKEKETSQFPPMPSVNPSREPLKPNLNFNNHNLDPMYVEDEYVDSPFSE